MADLLDQVISEISRRRDELRPLVDEYQRLQAAEATLGDDAQPSRRPRRPQQRARSAQAEPGKKRAPRGKNRQRVLEVVNERPGVSGAELASATGIARPTLATTVRKLVRDGEVKRVELP